MEGLTRTELPSRTIWGIIAGDTHGAPVAAGLVCALAVDRSTDVVKSAMLPQIEILTAMRFADLVLVREFMDFLPPR